MSFLAEGAALFAGVPTGGVLSRGGLRNAAGGFQN